MVCLTLGKKCLAKVTRKPEESFRYSVLLQNCMYTITHLYNYAHASSFTKLYVHKITHLYNYAHAHVSTILTRAPARRHVCAYRLLSTFTCMYIYIYIYIYVYIYICVYRYIPIHIHFRYRARIWVHIYIYISFSLSLSLCRLSMLDSRTNSVHCSMLVSASVIGCVRCVI